MRDPNAWARDVYGWGADFDSDLALFRLARLLDTLASLAWPEPMAAVELQRFLPAFVAQEGGAPKIVAPFTAEATNTAIAEFGAALFPWKRVPPRTGGLPPGPTLTDLRAPHPAG